MIEAGRTTESVPRDEPTLVALELMPNGAQVVIALADREVVITNPGEIYVSALAVPSSTAVSDDKPPPNFPIGVRTAAMR